MTTLRLITLEKTRLKTASENNSFHSRKRKMLIKKKKDQTCSYKGWINLDNFPDQTGFFN